MGVSEVLRKRMAFAMSVKGMTQADMHRASGLSRSRVSELLSGTVADPRISTVLAVADALGVTVDYLVGHDAGSAVAAPTPDEAALLADYRALDAASKAFVRRTAASEAAEARAKMPAPRSASSEVA